MTKSVLQKWVQDLTFMQQSVLMSAIRGPDYYKVVPDDYQLYIGMEA